MSSYNDTIEIQGFGNKKNFIKLTFDSKDLIISHNI